MHNRMEASVRADSLEADAGRAEAEMKKTVNFLMTTENICIEQDAKELSTDKQGEAIHTYIPDMNMRRYIFHNSSVFKAGLKLDNHLFHTLVIPKLSVYNR